MKQYLTPRISLLLVHQNDILTESTEPTGYGYQKSGFGDIFDVSSIKLD